MAGSFSSPFFIIYGLVWNFLNFTCVVRDIKQINDLPVYVVYNKKYGRIEHFVVEVNRNFLDSDGMQSNYSLIDKVAKDGFYNPEDLEVIEYNENLNHATIVRDLDVSKKFVDEFNKLS
jgi:hypothetical protein